MSTAARLRTFLALSLAAVVVGLAVASQSVAWTFHFPREFGRGLMDVGAVRFYAPWAFLGWYGAFERLYPRPFDEAALCGLAAAMLPLSLAIVVMRRSGRSPRTFGADAWAQLRDIQ